MLIFFELYSCNPDAAFTLNLSIWLALNLSPGKCCYFMARVYLCQPRMQIVLEQLREYGPTWAKLAGPTSPYLTISNYAHGSTHLTFEV